MIRPRGREDSLGGRLGVIHEGMLEVLDAFPPSALALEQVHSHVKHPRTAILMAHARGVIVLAAAAARRPGRRLRRRADQEDADRQRQGPQGADAARDPDRARPRPPPRAPRRRRRLRRGPLPLPDRARPARRTRESDTAHPGKSFLSGVAGQRFATVRWAGFGPFGEPRGVLRAGWERRGLRWFRTDSEGSKKDSEAAQR